MKRTESPPISVPMLRVSFPADIESRIDKRPPQPPRIRRTRRKASAPTIGAGPDLDQVRARLLKMIVQNERERSHDHRAS
jgi:hypothetical protein